MGITGSLILIAIGAILTFAVTTTVNGIDLHVVGWVLMIVGAFGLLISALFWSWLWGIAGLVIATPISACLAELGVEIPGFRWMNTMFSSAPASPVLGPDAPTRTPPPISPLPEA